MARETDPIVVGRVVGDVLDPFTRSVPLRITYSSREVTNGREFKPSRVAHQPRVEIGRNDLRTFYTLVMVDPDAPSPSNQHLREYLHWDTRASLVTLVSGFLPYIIILTGFITWNINKPLYLLVTDIPGSTGASFGKEIMCYEGPRPTAGIHRFIFVLSQQLGCQTVYAPDWRQNFNTRDFAELYNLGSPVAAVYFNCQRESGSRGRRMYA